MRRDLSPSILPPLTHTISIYVYHSSHLCSHLPADALFFFALLFCHIKIPPQFFILSWPSRVARPCCCHTMHGTRRSRLFAISKCRCVLYVHENAIVSVCVCVYRIKKKEVRSYLDRFFFDERRAVRCEVDVY